MPRALVAVYLHLIWAAWDRLPLLDATIEREVYRAIEAKAKDRGADVLAIGGIEDHIHMLVELPSTLTIADLVGGVKGASAHLVTHTLRPQAYFRWQGGYAAFSVGSRQLTAVKAYIARQREHHASNSPDVRWEATALRQLHTSNVARTIPSVPTDD